MLCAIDRFREQLKSGRFCLGVGVTFFDPAVTEALGPSVDFVWVDLEHNPISLESLQAHLIAARATNTPALVRVPSSEVATIKRVLDTGAEGLIVPQVHSAAEVRQVADASRYPPIGQRGYGPRRPSNYGRGGGVDYLKEANEKLFVAVQIETKGALAEVDKILEVPGIDSIVLGPNDLANSLGHVGQVNHPEVIAAIQKVIDKTRSAGKFVGMGMADDVGQAATARGLGVHWLQCGSDFSYLVNHTERLFREIRSRVA